MNGKTVFVGFLGIFGFLGIAPDPAFAVYAPRTYMYKHHAFEIDPDYYPAWRSSEEVWTYRGKEIPPPAALRVDGDSLPSLPEGVVRTTAWRWDREAIAATIAQKIARTLDREAGSVVIDRHLDGSISFDGVGMLGRRVNVEEAADLTVRAIELGITDIFLPVEEVQPEITVQSRTIRDLGITEVVSVGESDYRGSPTARRHNIGVGLYRFDGTLIKSGETFSFNAILGPVSEATGYQEELVIKGDKTLPDYGGGLCQVSTTAYRGVWEYGFPIEQRRNHSYSVRYYAPAGTDATIYPPHTDIRFTNDSDHALLIQTHVRDGRAYFIYYGTRDDRDAEIIGPYVWDEREPPPDKTEMTDEIEPGEERKVGERVPGMKSAWFRIVRRESGQETVEPFYSHYEARPLYIQIGVEHEDAQDSQDAQDAQEKMKKDDPLPLGRPRRWLERIRIRR